ncbi:hypothetical protein ABT404_19010 [Streptomyces hyaluromycini]|uniref:Uncharacterized protein n=1 Tax=Streptomyces hyaluromycini TaxID=1377993 RepID=A0ABV1WXP3_9ACTN
MADEERNEADPRSLPTCAAEVARLMDLRSAADVPAGQAVGQYVAVPSSR